jgi:ribonuclease D
MLENAIRKARETPESRWPRQKKKKRGEHFSRRSRAALAMLREKCAVRAEALNIDTAIFAPKSTLVIIARQCPRNMDELMSCGSIMKWQAKILFPIVIDVLNNLDKRQNKSPKK